MQQPDYNSDFIFHERNDLVSFILSVINGVCYMNIRCNQQFMFRKDRGIDFSFWLCRGYVWYARPALLGISTLPPNGRKKDASTDIENQTFGADVTNDILYKT